MKALKSDLAKRVLADPRARAQLREAHSMPFGSASSRSVASARRSTIEVHDRQGRVIHRVTPRVVPKAA